MSGEFELVLKLKMVRKQTTYYVLGHVQSGDPSNNSRVTAECVRRWNSLCVNMIEMKDLWWDWRNRRELRAYFLYAGLSRDQIENPILWHEGIHNWLVLNYAKILNIRTHKTLILSRLLGFKLYIIYVANFNLYWSYRVTTVIHL